MEKTIQCPITQTLVSSKRIWRQILSVSVFSGMSKAVSCCSVARREFKKATMSRSIPAIVPGFDLIWSIMKSIIHPRLNEMLLK